MKNIMILNKAISQLFGINELLRKEDSLYWYSPDTQVIKQMSIETIWGNREYRLWFKVGCLADSITEFSGMRLAMPKATLQIPDDHTYLMRVALGYGDMVHFNQDIHKPDTKYTSADMEASVCRDLEGMSEQFLTPFFAIQNVGELYNYRKNACDAFEKWKSSPKADFLASRPADPMFTLRLSQQQLYPQLQLSLWEDALVTARKCLSCFQEIRKEEYYDSASQNACILEQKETDIQAIQRMLEHGEHDRINELVSQRTLASRKVCDLYLGVK